MEDMMFKRTKQNKHKSLKHVSSRKWAIFNFHIQFWSFCTICCPQSQSMLFLHLPLLLTFSFSVEENICFGLKFTILSTQTQTTNTNILILTAGFNFVVMILKKFSYNLCHIWMETDWSLWEICILRVFGCLWTFRNVSSDEMKHKTESLQPCWQLRAAEHIFSFVLYISDGCFHSLFGQKEQLQPLTLTHKTACDEASASIVIQQSLCSSLCERNTVEILQKHTHIYIITHAYIRTHADATAWWSSGSYWGIRKSHMTQHNNKLAKQIYGGIMEEHLLKTVR